MIRIFKILIFILFVITSYQQTFSKFDIQLIEEVDLKKYIGKDIEFFVNDINSQYKFFSTITRNHSVVGLMFRYSYNDSLNIYFKLFLNNMKNIDPHCTLCDYKFEEIKKEIIAKIEWFIFDKMTIERKRFKESLDSLEEVENNN